MARGRLRRRGALMVTPLVLAFVQCGQLDERDLNEEASGGSTVSGGPGGVSSGGRGGSLGNGGTATGSAPGTSGGSVGESGAGGAAAGDSGGPAGAGGAAAGDSGGSAGAGGDQTPGGGEAGAGAGGCAGNDCAPICPSGQRICGLDCIPSAGCCVPADCPATATCSNSNACVCNTGYFGKGCNYYFKALGFGASTHNEGQVNGVSGDGNVPVGWSKGASTERLAVRWIQEVGRLIPMLQDGYEAMATAASSDGSTIVGDASVSTGGPSSVVAFRFQGSAVTALQLLDLGLYSHATAVSSDGTVIVGWGDRDSEFRGLRWTNGTVGAVGSVDAITPLALSANGQILLGIQGTVSTADLLGTVRYGTLGGAAMRYTTTFALLDGGGIATASSSNGNIAAGYTGARATRWNGTTPQDLGPGAAYAISGDGSVVVGVANDLAMIWDATNGARSLTTVLTQAGVSLTGWTLREATGISTNGKVIVGNGAHGTATEPWIVRLP